MIRRCIFPAVALLLASASASAHVTLEEDKAPAGSTYKAVFRVPHGCDGKPTLTVRVRVPEGMIGVKPMPKPGWTLEKVKGKYARTYKLHGAEVSEGVTEIVWSGGSLPDDEYDEFVFRGTLAGDLAPGATVYFPIVQECSDGAVERWIEIPAKGQSSEQLEKPAPSITLTDKAGGH